MIQVEMIDDIRKTETKAIGPLTLRQAICIIIAGSYSLPIAMILPVDIFTKIIVGFILALPVALCGWVKLNKEPFEIVLTRYIYKHFLTPQKRKYKVVSPYKKALQKVRAEEKQEKINQMSAKEKAEYEKKLKKGKVITYSQDEDYKVYR